MVMARNELSDRLLESERISPTRPAESQGLSSPSP